MNHLNAQSEREQQTSGEQCLNVNSHKSKCKALNMEVDQTLVDERIDTEWTLFFQNALQSDPKLGYNETNPCYTYSGQFAYRYFTNCI